MAAKGAISALVKWRLKCIVGVSGRWKAAAPVARFLNRARPIMTPFIRHNSITTNSHCMHIIASGICSLGALPDLSNAHTGNYQVTRSTALFSMALWTGLIINCIINNNIMQPQWLHCQTCLSDAVMYFACIWGALYVFKRTITIQHYTSVRLNKCISTIIMHQKIHSKIIFIHTFKNTIYLI